MATKDHHQRKRVGASSASHVIVVHQNVKSAEYSVSSAYVNLTCEQGYVGVARARCPNTNATLRTNCTGGAAVIPRACAEAKVATCLAWDATASTWSSEICEVINYTATNTTCKCSLGGAGGDDDDDDEEAVGTPYSSGSEALLMYFIGVREVLHHFVLIMTLQLRESAVL